MAHHELAYFYATDRQYESIYPVGACQGGTPQA